MLKNVDIFGQSTQKQVNALSKMHKRERADASTASQVISLAVPCIWQEMQQDQ